jgi:hypothetical protein
MTQYRPVWICLISICIGHGFLNAQLANDLWSGEFGDSGLEIAGLGGVTAPAAGPSATTVDAAGNVYLAGGNWNLLDGSEGQGASYAKWTQATGQWEAFGGLAGAAGVFEMVVADDGTVYVGGGWNFFIDGANLIQTQGVVMWNGSNWAGVGGGVSGGAFAGLPASVEAMVMDEAGNLYVGGTFTKAGTVDARNVAMWNGESWSALGAGLDSRVATLAIGPDGTLYAGGVFNEGSVRRIARWDGSQWQGMANGFTSGEVNSITFDDDGNIYAGGTYTLISDPNNGPNFTTANHVAVWDGTQWHALQSGLNEDVRALAFANGFLFAGGHFTATGDNQTSLSSIAVWNGVEWQPVGDGMDFVNGPTASSEPVVFHLHLVKNPEDPTEKHLFAAGPFDRAGDKIANNVALLEIPAAGAFELTVGDWAETPDIGWVYGYTPTIGFGVNFGYISIADAPWYYHYNGLGWIYFQSAVGTTLYWYSPDRGWLIQDFSSPWYTYDNGTEWVWDNFVNPVSG